MHFNTKSYLKSTRNHIANHAHHGNFIARASDSPSKTLTVRVKTLACVSREWKPFFFLFLFLPVLQDLEN
jgi:hypothetical protein